MTADPELGRTNQHDALALHDVCCLQCTNSVLPGPLSFVICVEQVISTDYNGGYIDGYILKVGSAR